MQRELTQISVGRATKNLPVVVWDWSSTLVDPDYMKDQVKAAIKAISLKFLESDRANLLNYEKIFYGSFKNFMKELYDEGKPFESRKFLGQDGDWEKIIKPAARKILDRNVKSIDAAINFLLRNENLKHYLVSNIRAKELATQMSETFLTEENFQEVIGFPDGGKRGIPHKTDSFEKIFRENLKSNFVFVCDTDDIINHIKDAKERLGDDVDKLGEVTVYLVGEYAKERYNADDNSYSGINVKIVSSCEEIEIQGPKNQKSMVS